MLYTFLKLWAVPVSSSFKLFANDACRSCIGSDCLTERMNGVIRYIKSCTFQHRLSTRENRCGCIHFVLPLLSINKKNGSELLPVIPRGTSSAVMEYNTESSNLWSSISKFSMRHFRKFLLFLCMETLLFAVVRRKQSDKPLRNTSDSLGVNLSEIYA